MHDIKKILTQILRSEFENKVSVVCKVKKIVDGYVICTNVMSGAVYSKIRMQAYPDAPGVLVVPKEGSYVIVTWMTGTEGHITAWGAVDSIRFMDGSYGGIVKIEDLMTSLNNLENKVNDLITYINTHVHPTVGSVPSPVFLGGNVPVSVRGNLENTLVTHGTV